MSSNPQAVLAAGERVLLVNPEVVAGEEEAAEKTGEERGSRVPSGGKRPSRPQSKSKGKRGQ